MLVCYVTVWIIQVQLIEDDKSFLDFPRIEELNEMIDKSGCDLPLKVPNMIMSLCTVLIIHHM